MKEYITKDRAKQFVCGHCNEVCSEEPCEPSDCDWMAFIDKEPSADVVEVRHAKWNDDYKCTACGNEALLEEKPDPLAHGLNSLFFVDSDYCPHCGCKMDREE